MFRFAPYVLKSLWRHRTRTLLTVGGSAAALFVFVFVEAARQGLADLTRGAAAERTLIVYQANRFCPSSSRLPEEYARGIEKIDGVSDVIPIQVHVNNCRASLDLVLCHGIPIEKLGSRKLQVTSGDLVTFENRDDGALAGRALARRRGLQPGSRFTIGSISVHIAGIFTAASAAEENVLYTHLKYLQQAKGSAGLGVVTQFEVQLAENANADAVSRTLDATFRTDRVATDTRPRGAFQASVVSDLAELIDWSRYLGYACVGLVLALVTSTTVMAVQDRAREHAVLQAIGFSGLRIFCLVLAEGILVSLAGGLLGGAASLGILALWPFALGTEGVVLALRPSLALALSGGSAALVVGVIASVVPAWQAARAEIVAALRN